MGQHSVGRRTAAAADQRVDPLARQLEHHPALHEHRDARAADAQRVAAEPASDLTVPLGPTGGCSHGPVAAAGGGVPPPHPALAKALRLYEAHGLITPAAVDLEPGARRAAVEGWWSSVEAGVRERRALLDTLHRPADEEPAVHEIALRPIPEGNLLTAERRLTVEDLPAFIGDAAERITRHLDASGATEAGPLRVIYHGMVTEDSDGPVEVAVPFTGREAVTALTRREVDFPQILGAYDAVGRWIDQAGLTRAGSPAEVYLTSRAAADADPAAVHLEVAWPVT